MLGQANRVKMYFISITILPQTEGVDLPIFVQKVADIISDPSNNTSTVYSFKVHGEPKLIFVVNISNNFGLERAVTAIWRQGAVQVDCQPVISYESFARSIKVDDQLAQPSSGRLAKDGLYWLQFDVDYHGKTTEKLIKIWKKEAEAVFESRHKEGASIELYKCVAQRQVHAFINAPTPEQLDALSFQLPLILENGANVQLKCKAVHYLEDYMSMLAMASDSI